MRPAVYPCTRRSQRVAGRARADGARRVVDLVRWIEGNMKGKPQVQQPCDARNATSPNDADPSPRPLATGPDLEIELFVLAPPDQSSAAALKRGGVAGPSAAPGSPSKACPA